jgi:hypothetical protein
MVDRDSGRDHYPETLFEKSEVEVLNFTDFSMIYTANIGAGFMVNQFARWGPRFSH